jgi:hypothetical protein
MISPTILRSLDVVSCRVLLAVLVRKDEVATQQEMSGRLALQGLRLSIDVEAEDTVEDK